MLWGNDYLHHEGTFPYNLESRRLTFAGMPETRRRKLLVQNIQSSWLGGRRKCLIVGDSMNPDARCLFTVVFLIAIFVSPLLNAAPPQVVPPAELKGLERATGFTAQQVRKSMLAQDSAAEVVPKLRKLLGATFGGGWFDLSTGQAVVATTDPKEKNLILKHGATPVVVKNSFKKLNGIVQKLNRTSMSSPPPDGLIHEWEVDVKNNRVVMTISADMPLGLLKAQDFIRASGVDPNEVHIVKTKQPLYRVD